MEKFVADEKFLYPINPGMPSSLAGTMGELRSTHFHSGIDIRTGNLVGLPVVASKSGYISRITVTPSGYGNVLYITHPDGHTTLYAHLDKFAAPLAEYVLKEQYRRKTFDIDLYFRNNQFNVKQGDTIALSGNTGSSGGPHLHFDIRDSKNLALNPLRVESFTEIVDNLPPSVEKIALTTLDKNSRINDKFGRFEFYAQRVGNDFAFTAPILATGSIGVEILAKDRLAPRSRFWGGVNHIEVRVDSQLVFQQNIDKINTAESRGIFTLMDYKTFRRTGNRFYKLYIDDGNDLDFYSKSPGRGKINVRKQSDVTITMKDSHGNASNVSFQLMPALKTTKTPFLQAPEEALEYDIQGNIMIVTAQRCSTDTTATVYAKRRHSMVIPDYGNDVASVYLIDLNKELPDSIVVCGKSLVTNFVTTVPSGREYNYYSDNVEIYFPSKALFDTTYLVVKHSVNADSSTEVLTIGSRTDPIDRSIRVNYRPKFPVQWDRSTGIYRKGGADDYTFLGGKWENGSINFFTREFGDFTILKDTVPPSIRMIALNNTAARFKIKDDLSGISSFEASVDGKWLLMNYDAKTNTIWSERLVKSEPLKGEFLLVVKDEAGNESRYTHTIY